MAVEVVMPKQGNSVESCIILDWKVAEGDAVSVGDVMCEAETDKSTIEVESTAEGTVLKLLFQAGDEVPVMQPIAVVGAAGERVDASVAAAGPSDGETGPAGKETKPSEEKKIEKRHAAFAPPGDGAGIGVSPRARAAAASLSEADVARIAPSGPKGRVIERDVLAALQGREPLTPAAVEVLSAGGREAPVKGTGIGGRVLSGDLTAVSAVRTDRTSVSNEAAVQFPGAFTESPVKGVRKVTAKRMHESIATTAQLTMNAYADATALQTLRSRFKTSAPEFNLQKITINDIILFAVSKTIRQFPYMNGHFLGDRIITFEHVHLGCAVDTPKGLLVPVVKYADERTLSGISTEFKRLAAACIEGKAAPDDLTGGTFTVTNLGAMGVDTFTPVINVPEVAILGVGGISMRAVGDAGGDYAFVPHIGLSLTIDHQAVDGAPGARFLKALCENIASIDMMLAL